MPHTRERYLAKNLEKAATFSALIGVLGHRQVGKTTLLHSYSSDYHTLDLKNERDQAIHHPDEYIASLRGRKTIIDEAQLAPEIFFALKERVRVKKSPGQFILSGSVRFTSKKLIRESLTGRIQYLELLPFSIAELEHDPLPTRVLKILESNNLQRYLEQTPHSQQRHTRKTKLMQAYLTQGGLPGICFIRNETARMNKIRDQLLTILDRDLREVCRTPLPYERIETFCRTLAATQGSPVQYSSIQKQTELTPITQQKLIHALESIFVVRRIPVEGGMKGYALIFEDQAESYYFSKYALSLETQLTHLLYRNIRTEFAYRPEQTASFFQYRTRAGVEVPLALRSNDRALGLIPIRDESSPSREEKAAGDSFLRFYRDSQVVFFHSGRTRKAINDRMAILPITELI